MGYSCKTEKSLNDEAAAARAGIAVLKTRPANSAESALLKLVSNHGASGVATLLTPAPDEVKVWVLQGHVPECWRAVLITIAGRVGDVEDEEIYQEGQRGREVVPEAELVQLVRDGVKTSVIAARYGVSRQAVLKRVKALRAAGALQ